MGCRKFFPSFKGLFFSRGPAHGNGEYKFKPRAYREKENKGEYGKRGGNKGKRSKGGEGRQTKERRK